jgi:hypothetical protein
MLLWANKDNVIEMITNNLKKLATTAPILSQIALINKATNVELHTILQEMTTLIGSFDNGISGWDVRYIGKETPEDGIFMFGHAGGLESLNYE